MQGTASVTPGSQPTHPPSNPKFPVLREGAEESSLEGDLGPICSPSDNIVFLGALIPFRVFSFASP